ncbi:MAG: hypothetical protein ACP5N9_06320 [Candidatus Bilamarchaeum sp.]
MLYPNKDVISSSVFPCPNCGESMSAIRGSMVAKCKNCGFKDSCCF